MIWAHTAYTFTNIQTHAYIMGNEEVEVAELERRWGRVPFLFSALLHYKQALFCESSGKSDKNAEIYYHSNTK